MNGPIKIYATLWSAVIAFISSLGQHSTPFSSRTLGYERTGEFGPMKALYWPSADQMILLNITKMTFSPLHPAGVKSMLLSEVQIMCFIRSTLKVILMSGSWLRHCSG
jgi:hypothetical protein